MRRISRIDQVWSVRPRAIAGVHGSSFFCPGPGPEVGEANDAEWKTRLEAALTEADTYLFRGGHYPALATAARGLTLRALGRAAEGEAALRQVFTLPDKGMAHEIARLALQEPEAAARP